MYAYTEDQALRRHAILRLSFEPSARPAVRHTTHVRRMPNGHSRAARSRRRRGHTLVVQVNELGEIFTGPAATFCQPPLRQPFRLYAVGASSVFHVVADVSSSLVSPRRSHAYDDEDPTNGRQRLYPPYPSSASLDSASLGVPTPQSTVAIYGLRLRSQVNISILPNNFPVRLGYYPCGVVCLLGRVSAAAFASRTSVTLLGAHHAAEPLVLRLVHRLSIRLAGFLLIPQLFCGRQ